MRENFVAGSLGSRCIAKKRNVTGFNEVQQSLEEASAWRDRHSDDTFMLLCYSVFGSQPARQQQH